MGPRAYLAIVGLFCSGLVASAATADLSGAQTQAAGAALRVTVIGCVQRSQPAGGDKTGTTVIPAGETKYMLSNITLVPDGGADVVAENVKMYRLDDAGNARIAPHVGKRVRVDGTIVPPSASPRGTTGQAAPPTEASRAPMLRVNSLQTISSSSAVCSR